MVCDPNQSTSDTNIKGKCLLYNRRTAHFNLFGNYFSVRKNSKDINGSFPVPSKPDYQRKLRPIPINFTNLPV